jgi:hypothetical protein
MVLDRPRSYNATPAHIQKHDFIAGLVASGLIAIEADLAGAA